MQNIVYRSELMREVLEQAERAARSSATVLVTGESGVGKELVAAAIHQWSDRRTEPFVPVNMAAVPETLMESELFGHAQGAFTGAVSRRIGRFQAANKGSLFLDEIGDLPLAVQAKLLRALESRSVVPVGSNEPVDVDVRVVAATNRDLEQLVEDGEFRDDLYYRLNVVRIDIPPLRRRREDVSALADCYLAKFAQANGRPGLSIDDRLMEFLTSCDWPGNVRQLRNAIESMVVLSDGDTLTLDDVPATVTSRKLALAPQEISATSSLEEIERAAIEQRLEFFGGSQRRAAQSLGISVRTLQRRLHSWRGEVSREDLAMDEVGEGELVGAGQR